MANEQISEITTVPTNATVIKIINTLIKRYNSLGSIYTFKGSVQTYDDLLIIQNPNVGDVYNVVQEDEEHQIAAGSNFVWDGTVWDNLGGSLAGLVQSVNGINPDSLGNVLLPLIKNITTNQGVITFTKNDDTTIQVDNIKKLYTVGLGQTVDLNNLVEAGIYICDNDSYAANYENCPVQKSFLLEVQQANDGSMVYQFLTQYNDGSMEAGNQYVRTYQVTNGWTDWVKYVLASDLNGAVDNLTEQVTEVSTALTAHKDDHNNPHQVTAAQLGLATVYKYKGSVETYANLPTSGQQVGDVYNVKQADPDHNIEAGDNVAWDGEKWDILAGDTDLSGYAQLNSANTFTALNTFRANIIVSNGTAAGSSGNINFGISPTNETVQARIGTDNLGGLFYHASTNQPHVFRIGTNNDVLSIRSDTSKMVLISNNKAFTTVTYDGVAKWLGNANTATKLETARTINGVAFDGTKDITIDIPKPVIASEAEAKAGTDNTKFMTPLRVAQAIDSLDGNPITGASISGKTITLTKKDGSKITLNTQDTNTSNWSISKGTNGWARENTTGFTIQWGDTTTFPRTFTTAFQVVMQTDNNKGEQLYKNQVTVTSIFNNGFTIGSPGQGQRYVAFGIS